VKRKMLIIGFMVFCAAGACDRLKLDRGKETEQKLTQEISRLQEHIRTLEEELDRARMEVLDLQAKNAELINQAKLKAFQTEEISRTLERYTELEIQKNLLEQKVRELQGTVRAQEAAIRELMSQGPEEGFGPEEAPDRGLRKGDCVQWFGSAYKERLRMVGRVEGLQSGGAVLVRCTESAMPYQWAEDQLYEIPENALEVCESP